MYTRDETGETSARHTEGVQTELNPGYKPDSDENAKPMFGKRFKWERSVCATTK